MADFISTDLDIFATKHIQYSDIDIFETQHKPIAPIGQSDIEFVINGDSDRYVALNPRLYLRGKLEAEDGTPLAATDYTGVVNKLLSSLFSQGSVSLNGVSVSHSKDLYNYGSLLETLLTYGSDATTSHLTKQYFYLDSGNTAYATGDTNQGFIDRWNRLNRARRSSCTAACTPTCSTFRSYCSPA